MTTITGYKELARLATEDTGIGERFVERHTPGPDNACKEPKCNGVIESRLRGSGPDGNFFKTPACNVCGRNYLLAHNARQVGFVEFRGVMNQVYAI